MKKQYQAVDYLTEEDRMRNSAAGIKWQHKRECDHFHRSFETAQRCAAKNGFQGVDEVLV